MNERILELAEQAGIGFWGNRIIIFDFSADSEEIIQKFTELVVRECARVARATPAPAFEEHLKEQLGHTWDMAALEAGREIIKHFGVEE
jgi:hypothetical protein